jgi:hypothetical protein
MSSLTEIKDTSACLAQEAKWRSSNVGFYLIAWALLEIAKAIRFHKTG